MTHEPIFDPKLLTALRSAQRVAALTGAGVSAESGIPTFREAQSGLWARYDPMDLASPEAFARNPALVWEWYTWRRSLVAQAKPNFAHAALAELERRAAKFTLITQNVDNLHQEAGSRQVIELHGSLLRNRCAREGVVVSEWQDEGGTPPRCKHCGAHLRPDVVWFGESLPAEALAAARAAARECEVFFSIGTSALVYPAAALPIEAVQAGAVLVEINTEPTPLTREATYVVPGPAAQRLPALLEAVWPSDQPG